MKPNRFIIYVLASGILFTLSSCRSRSSSRTQKKSSPAVQSTTAPNAKQVMNRADSVLANLGALRGAESEAARVTPSDYPARNQWGAPIQSVAPDPSGYSLFESGLASYNSGDYNSAINAFSQIAGTGKPAELVPNAYYWLGESYFASNRFQESLPYFEYCLRAGPQYRRESAMYKLSLAALMSGKDELAATTYERLRAEYPKSSYIAKLKKAGVR